MNTIITESVEVPFETISKISEKINAIRDNHGNGAFLFYDYETGKIVDLNTGKEVRDMGKTIRGGKGCKGGCKGGRKGK